VLAHNKQRRHKQRQLRLTSSASSSVCSNLKKCGSGSSASTSQQQQEGVWEWPAPAPTPGPRTVSPPPIRPPVCTEAEILHSKVVAYRPPEVVRMLRGAPASVTDFFNARPQSERHWQETEQELFWSDSGSWA
jgi:hypothetical protein